MCISFVTGTEKYPVIVWRLGEGSVCVCVGVVGGMDDCGDDLRSTES